MELKRKNIELYELYQGLEGLYEAYPDLRTVVREIQRDIEDRLSSCSTNIER
jgi:hypothetical protein